MKNVIAPKWLLAVLWAATIALFVLLGGKVHAAEQWIPDNDDMSEGTQVFLEVSRPGNGNALDAHLTYAKVYFKSSTGTVEIRSKDHCESGPDSVTFAPTRFRFLHVNNDENIATVAPLTAANNENAAHITSGSCPGDTPVTLSGLKSPNVPGRQGWYVAIIEAEHRGGANSGGVNAFRIRAVNGRAEYWDMGSGATTPGEPGRRAFAIQDRFVSGNDTGTYKFRFAPRCNQFSETSQIAYLKWTDADQGESNQPENIRYELRSYDRATYTPDNPGTVLNTVTRDGAAMGGNNDYRNDDFMVRKDRVYEWEWFNVNKLNGIQMWMPYDSFDAKVQCHAKVIAYRVPTGTLTQGDVNGQPIEVKQPFAGTNFNQTDTTGDTAEYNNVPYGGIRVDGSNNRGYEMKSLHRICRKDLPCSDFIESGWGNTIRVDNYNVDAGATVDVRIRYRRPAFAAACQNPPTSNPADAEDLIRAGREDVSFGVRFNNTGSSAWPANGRITARASFSGNSQTVAMPATASGSTTDWINIGTFDIPRSLARRTLVFEVLLDGNPIVDCRRTVVPWSNFTMTPLGTGGTFDDEESPTKFTFGSGVNVTYVDTEGAPHFAGPRTTREIYKQPAVGPVTTQWSDNSYTGNYDDSVSFPSQEVPVTSYAAGDRYCGVVRLDYSQGKLRRDSDGNMVVFDLSTPATSTPLCDTVTNKPYLKIYGNDVMAGGGFGTGCTPHGGGIRTNAKQNAANRFIGSSAQHAAFALNQITGFTSANLRTSFPQAHKDLSFANHGAGVNTSWTNASPNAGGFFDPPAASTCMPDYFSYNSGSTLFPGAAPPAQWAQARNFLNSVEAGTDFQRRRTSSGTTINLNGPADIVIRPGQRKILFVDGTLNINTDIVYENWASLDDVPALYIVAREINISNAVTRLDGVYIAQPSNATNGNITTCSQGLDYAGCRNQLTVNGSFIARKINFLRTYGTLRDGVAAEAPSTARACTTPPGATAADSNNNRGICAGEVFRFSPELYLAPSPFGAGDGFDSYRGLPPNL